MYRKERGCVDERGRREKERSENETREGEKGLARKLRVQEISREFKRFRESSRDFEKVQEISREFERVREISREFERRNLKVALLSCALHCC
eukprot:1381936-Amorphochlora_amoeboformis.AAC.1